MKTKTAPQVSPVMQAVSAYIAAALAQQRSAAISPPREQKQE